MSITFIRCVIILGFLVVVANVAAAQETFTLHGKVVDSLTGLPIASANIVVRGTTFGTSTDKEGRFSLTLRTGQFHVISITHINYGITVRVFDVKSPREIEILIKPKPRAIPLDEVTVIADAPFEQRRALFTLSKKDFEQLAEPDMDRALRYLLPGTIAPWDVRFRNPSREFTLYLNGEWRESFDLLAISPQTVTRVLVWDAQWSPVGMPARRGGLVVSIETHPVIE